MIQQIVDENGTLRHIILSALNNNGSTQPPPTALMPPQQPQQLFPACCCCCYSCTGGPPPAPLPPPPPPAPQQQVHHNILAFNPQPNRRRLPARAYSPAGKRSSTNFYNNNSLGKLPVRNKIPSSTPTPGVDGVSKITYPNSKLATSSDSKSYELSENSNLEIEKNHSENCLDQEIHVVNSVCNKESLQEDIRNGLDTNHVQVKQNTNQNQFKFVNHDERNKLTIINEIINCPESDDSNLVLSNQEDLNLNKQQQISQNDEESLNYEFSPVDSVEETRIIDDLNSEFQDNQVNHRILSQSESRIEYDNDYVDVDVDVDSIDLIDRISEDNYTDYCKENNYNTQIQNNSNISNVDEEIEQFQMSKESNLKLDHKSDQIQNNHNDQLTITNNVGQEKLENSISNSINEQNNSLNSNLENHKKYIENNENVIDNNSGDNKYNERNERMERNDESINNKVVEKVNDNEIRQRECSKSSKQSPQRSPKHLLPQLQLLNLTYISLTANTVKLKWQQQQPHSSNDQLQLYQKHYVVEMLLNNKLENSSETNNRNFAASRIVYQGHSTNCRILHLSSQQQYSFRVRTTSDEHLVVSNVLTITTPEQPLNTTKSHKKVKQLMQYQQQQQQQQVNSQSKQHSNEQQNQITDDEEPAVSSDQRCAIVLLLLFTLFALIVAVIIHHLFN